MSDTQAPKPICPDTSPVAAKWMSIALGLAAAYNLLWGAMVGLMPGPTLHLLGMDGNDAALRNLWACIGMIVGVYGIGYAIAAFAPLRHWPIVLVGLLGKLLGPAGFVVGYWRGEVPGSLGWTLISNDLIWWAPFTLILLAAHRHARRDPIEQPTHVGHRTRTAWN